MSINLDKIVFLNGNFLPISKAHVSPLDRGFLFGDGVYEVAPIYQLKPFQLEAHLARLRKSMNAIGLPSEIIGKDFEAHILELIKRQTWKDQALYIQITRGTYSMRDHAFPKETIPTIFMMCSELSPIDKNYISSGIAAITTTDHRWHYCEIKSISLLGNVLARQSAIVQDALEAILIRDGFLTEGAASNIWIVRDNCLFAPPKNNNILPGVRYELMPTLCHKTGIPLTIRPLLREEIAKADEIIMSAALKGLLPITTLNGCPVGSGTPGPVFSALWQAYEDLKQLT